VCVCVCLCVCVCVCMCVFGSEVKLERPDIPLCKASVLI